KASLRYWARADFLRLHPLFSDRDGAAVVEIVDISSQRQGGIVSSTHVLDGIKASQWHLLWNFSRGTLIGRRAVLLWFESEKAASVFGAWLIRRRELKSRRAVG